MRGGHAQVSKEPNATPCALVTRVKRNGNGLEERRVTTCADYTVQNGRCITPRSVRLVSLLGLIIIRVQDPSSIIFSFFSILIVVHGHIKESFGR